MQFLFPSFIILQSVHNRHHDSNRYLYLAFAHLKTWVSNFYYDDAPLIFDKKYQKKPAYYALRDAIRTLSVGGIVSGNVKLNEEGEPWGHEWMPNQDSMTTTDISGDSRPDWEQT